MSIFERLDHLTILVQDLDAARRRFVDVFGGELLKEVGLSESEGFRWFTFELRGKKRELVSPTVPGEGGVGRYLAKHGDGFYHVSISVDSVVDASRFFKTHGLRVLVAKTDKPNWKRC